MTLRTPSIEVAPSSSLQALSDLYAQGRESFEQGRLAEAREICEFILHKQPRHFEALHLLAITCAEAGDRHQALSLFRQALELDPQCAPLHANLGRLLTNDGQLTAAWDSFQKALALNPSDPHTHNNLGNLYLQRLQLRQAMACYDQALSYQPDYPDATLNKAIAVLLSGDLAAGWPLYESRWQRARPTSPLRHFTQPLWLGSPELQGKTILLHAEQGLGDTLQFCRYAPRVAALGAHVILEAPSALLHLLSSLSGIHQLVAAGQPLPAFDYHCPLLSLPLAFHTTLATIPAPNAYLRSDPARRNLWAQRLGPKHCRRIGLVWSGNAQHTNDAQRSLPLAKLLPYLPPHGEYVSLQKEVRPTDLPALSSSPAIRHFGSDLQDFSDTAALCDLMDLVISVDTSVAHLAGALGCPTWLLLPHVPDWRWLLQRQDSPWYPCMQLFRQTSDGDWTAPLQQIAQQLQLS